MVRLLLDVDKLRLVKQNFLLRNVLLAKKSTKAREQVKGYFNTITTFYFFIVCE